MHHCVHVTLSALIITPKVISRTESTTTLLKRGEHNYNWCYSPLPDQLLLLTQSNWDFWGFPHQFSSKTSDFWVTWEIFGVKTTKTILHFWQKNSTLECDLEKKQQHKFQNENSKLKVCASVGNGSSSSCTIDWIVNSSSTQQVNKKTSAKMEGKEKKKKRKKKKNGERKTPQLIAPSPPSQSMGQLPSQKLSEGGRLTGTIDLPPPLILFTLLSADKGQQQSRHGNNQLSMLYKLASRSSRNARISIAALFSSAEQGRVKKCVFNKWPSE